MAATFFLLQRFTGMGGIGFEPTTSCVSSRRSKPTELTALKSVYIVSFKKYKKARIFYSGGKGCQFRDLLTTAAAERVCWVLLLLTVIVI